MTERTRTIWNALVANYDKWGGEWEMMGDAMKIVAGMTAEEIIEALDDTDRYIDDVHRLFGVNKEDKIRLQLMHVLRELYPEAEKRWSEAPRPEKVLTEAEKRAAKEAAKTARIFMARRRSN